VTPLVNFIPNLGLEDEWNASGDGQDCKRTVGEEIVSQAQAVAPVETGAYRDSIHVEADLEGETAVAADVDYAVFIEFGTSDTPTFAPLRRGATGAGYGP
jgi:hypothetical protein